ncbi:hypothetical protein [Rubritepida flocculans]|uniref:hypothetical protein n=1 Tax=Rubritepida flocculans TaxID=182403 RepID=UPI00047F8F49|nr:hypothetical protein [Rubritepida flocculans]
MRPFLARCFALLLLVQSGAALAHCLRGLSPGEGLLADICTPEGKRLLLLGPGGEPLEPPEPAAEGGFCPVCHGLPELVPPPPPVRAAPPRLAAPAPWHGQGEALRLPPGRVAPHAPRAPPALA